MSDAGGVGSGEAGAEGLQRHLGLNAGTMLVLGGIIGASIFLVPGAVADATGHPVLTLFVWLLAGLLSACAALSFAELGAAIPATGGTYVHLKRAYRSEVIAYCYGWMMLFGYGSAAVAVVAIMASSYLCPLIASAVGWSLEEAPTAAAIILSIAVVNVAGVKQGGRVQVLLTVTKLSLIASLIVIPFVVGEIRFDRFSTATMPASPMQVVSSVSEGLILCLFAYSGAHFVTQVAGEMKRPQRDIPRSIFVGFTTVMGAYLALNVVYLVSMPFETLRVSRAVAADLLRSMIGDKGAWLVSLAIVVSSLAVLNAQLMSYPRIVFALSNDGLLPRPISKVHPRAHTPWIAIVVVAFCAVLYVATGSYREILASVAFVSHLFIVLAVAGLIVLRVREPQLCRPYRASFYPGAQLLFIGISLLYLLSLIVTKPAQTLVGVAIVAAGLPFYALRKRTHRT